MRPLPLSKYRLAEGCTLGLAFAAMPEENDKPKITLRDLMEARMTPSERKKHGEAQEGEAEDTTLDAARAIARLSPITQLKSAIQAVPAVRWAEGVLGIVCVAVMIGRFNLNIFFAALCVLIILGLMYGLLLFAVAAKLKSTMFIAPAMAMIWTFVLTFIGILALAVGCVFWKKPISYGELLAQFSTSSAAKYETVIDVLNKEINSTGNELQDMIRQYKLLTLVAQDKSSALAKANEQLAKAESLNVELQKKIDSMASPHSTIQPLFTPYSLEVTPASPPPQFEIEIHTPKPMPRYGRPKE